MNIIHFTNDSIKGFDERKFTLTVFLDLSKAFDTDSHNSLLQNIHYGIRGTAHKCFSSYLSNHIQYVSFGNIILL